MMKIKNGGHFGRHLEFRRELQGDSWGLLVCCYTHIPGPILKNSACYELFPGFGLYLPNALGLLLLLLLLLLQLQPSNNHSKNYYNNCCYYYY